MAGRGIGFSGGSGGGAGAGIQKVADAAALAALAGVDGDYADRLDNNTLYRHDGTNWVAIIDDADKAKIQAAYDHISDGSDAHAASAITNTPAGTLGSTNVQAALNELDGDRQAVSTALNDHITDTTDAHMASSIGVTPTGNLAADDVQEALNEHQGDIDTLTAASHAAVTVGAVGSSPNANGLTLTGQALNLEPASATQPGVIANAAQSIPGEKRFAAGIAVGAVTALAAAEAFALNTTTKVSRPVPTMTTTQRNAIAGIPTGSQIYNSDTEEIELYNGTNWESLMGYSRPAAITVLNGATVTPSRYRRQIQEVSGNGTPANVATLSHVNLKDGAEIIFVGGSDTLTVTFNSDTDVKLNGSCTLGLNDTLTLVKVGTTLVEVGRSE